MKIVEVDKYELKKNIHLFGKLLLKGDTLYISRLPKTESPMQVYLGDREYLGEVPRYMFLAELYLILY